ncbi:MAG TPA: ornithine--oxo-acid transaminase [Burkholderiaceae bacterium]|nr:ornithine--oxo-acid transaminase [Burkholderiaceae bacterium]
MTPRSAAVDRSIELESRVAAPNYAPIPVVLQSGRGEWLFDLDGRRYLDLMSAYSAVSHGHAHPRLVKALTDQAAHVAVTSRAYFSATLGAFLEHLTGLCDLDPGRTKALPSSGGAEAVETAIKAARRWGYRVKGIAPDAAEIAVARGNFHGRSTTIVGFSTEEAYRADFGPFSPGFRHFDFGDIESLRAAINENTCAVLLEPIQGEAGIVVPPDGFLRDVRALCSERRVLMIVDEIQSGLGRTGRWFAFQHEGIVPDGVILGKALGGGLLPVSCFVAKREVMDVFEPGSHGSTFGGNPLAAAVGLEALRVIEEEGLVARSAALGAHLIARLGAIASPLVRQVRGRGLWVGVELDSSVSAREVVERLAERGVLTKDTHGTVIRFAPPLTISRDALDWGIDVFAETLRQFEHAASPAARAPNLAPRGVAVSAAREQEQRPRLMMSAPEHFEVSYRINPWMDPAQWTSSADRLRRQADQGWNALKDVYESLGVEVEIQAPQSGLPDLVFTANSALVLDRTALLARFRHPERRMELDHNRAFFAALKARGWIDSIVETPEDLYFEGAGDAIWDATRKLMWTGWGQRSSRPMAGVIARMFSVPTVALELVDPRFYHLDTCLCVLSGGEVVYYPAAFSTQAIETIRDLVDRDLLIEASAADAEHLAVNSVCLGDQVVMCYASDALRNTLTARGYEVHVVPLESFNRSGGSAYCLTLRLDLSSRPEAGTPKPVVQQKRPQLRRVA